MSIDVRHIFRNPHLTIQWNEASSSVKYLNTQFAKPDFQLKAMDTGYSNETITYFTQRGLEDRQVYPINGLIYNSALNLYDSTVEPNGNGEGEMLVMDRLGNMFIALKVRGIFHHSSFFSGNLSPFF